jgi:hypothetical protein
LVLKSESFFLLNGFSDPQEILLFLFLDLGLRSLTNKLLSGGPCGGEANGRRARSAG